MKKVLIFLIIVYASVWVVFYLNASFFHLENSTVAPCVKWQITDWFPFPKGICLEAKVF